MLMSDRIHLVSPALVEWIGQDVHPKAGAAAVQNARQQVTDTDRALVARLLNRELDHQ